MCGHAIIALTTLAFETGLVKRDGELQARRDQRAGRAHSFARRVMDGEHVSHVSFRNVPSFVYLRDQHVEVPGLGVSHSMSHTAARSMRSSTPRRWG